MTWSLAWVCGGRSEDLHAWRGIIGFTEAVEKRENVGGGAEVNDDDLVVAVVDEEVELISEASEFGGVEGAEEDAELEVVAVVGQCAEDIVAAFVVSDVVGDEELAAWHGFSGW